MEVTEEKLTFWIRDQVNHGAELNTSIICIKAKQIHDAICKEVNIEKEFEASPGWFYRFKERSGVKSVRKVGESAQVDRDEVDKFKVEIEKIKRKGGYSDEATFNVDETGLFWKKRYGRTFTTKDMPSVPGEKLAKERVTILLGKKRNQIRLRNTKILTSKVAMRLGHSN